MLGMGLIIPILLIAYGVFMICFPLMINSKVGKILDELEYTASDICKSRKSIERLVKIIELNVEKKPIEKLENEKTDQERFV